MYTVFGERETFARIEKVPIKQYTAGTSLPRDPNTYIRTSVHHFSYRSSTPQYHTPLVAAINYRLIMTFGRIVSRTPLAPVIGPFIRNAIKYKPLGNSAWSLLPRRFISSVANATIPSPPHPRYPKHISLIQLFHPRPGPIYVYRFAPNRCPRIPTIERALNIYI